MAGESDHRDPADLARERAEETAVLVAAAEAAEREAMEHPIGSSQRAVRMTEANNCRLKALCIHLRLPTLVINDGKDPE